MEQSVIDLLDIQGIYTEFEVECIKCPIHLMIQDGIRGPGKGDYYCKIIKRDCPWRCHSKRSSGVMNFAPSARVFNKYGFDLVNKKSTYKIGKCHFLYFLYHPAMNWQPPQERPERNRMGKIISPTDVWELSHRNGIFWDDSIGNLEWVWRSEHKVFEINVRKKNPQTIYEAGMPK